MSALQVFPLCLFLLGSAQQVLGKNDRPIIGIITQEVSDDVFFQYGKTYIADSYIKFLESAGSRVVPIRLNMTEEEYLHLFHSINGVLLPGGAVDLLTSSFARTAGIFYKLAIEATSSGMYFPVWGTCMGFQILTALTSGKDLLSNTSANNISLPLNLSDDISSSRMFRHVPMELLHAVTRENITANFHHFGITPENFQANKKLSTFYRILSTNQDRNGMEFVSTMEARDYPIYGVQWHPEVNRFQWSSDFAYPHSVNAVWISQYIANFFVNEARKNPNHFSNAKEEESALIYNWSPTYTANISGYEQSASYASPVVLPSLRQHTTQFKPNDIKYVMPRSGKACAEDYLAPRDISSSRMFRHVPMELLHAVTRENITANFHHFGITPENFQANKKLSTFYRILSTNQDRNGMEFVSTMEARDYPIYGVQWHPEVNRFQWSSDFAYPHSVNAVWISQYIANFFVNEARKNPNHFSNAKEEESALIYNWSPTYTANISGYEQVYFF